MRRAKLPPFDHPHVFLDMGDADEIICPYCSTLFRHDAGLDPHAARPPECALPEAPPPETARRGGDPVPSSRTVMIAGAGIGGLTAALAIAQHGFRVAIYDQAERLEEIGAGIQLSPNASRVLIALGLGDALRRSSSRPKSCG